MENEYFGELALIGMKGTEKFVNRVDEYLRQWRKTDESYIIDIDCPRFGTGEGKGIINQTVRGKDLFIYVDCFNYGVQYKMFGQMNRMSPDDHFQDLKRIIGACERKTRRISVIMPMLYEGRQHRRAARESLDCASALQELESMGVSDLITFDAHDSRVQNATPTNGFENVRTTYQMLKSLVREFPDVSFEPGKTMFVSPDEGGMARTIYYSSVLGVEVGTFYKRRNYAIIVDGRNPIEAHEFLGHSVAGRDIVVVDDMISSGDSMLDIMTKLRELGAKRIFMFCSFGLFTSGLEKFDKAYEEGLFDRIFTTNLNYRPEELLARPWYTEVSLCKYVAYIVDSINRNHTIGDLLDPVTRIHALQERVRKRQEGDEE